MRSTHFTALAGPILLTLVVLVALVAASPWGPAPADPGATGMTCCDEQ